MSWNWHKVDKIVFNNGITESIDKNLYAPFDWYRDPIRFNQPKSLEIGLYDIPASGSIFAYWTGDKWLDERTDFKVIEFSIAPGCPSDYIEYSKTLLKCHMSLDKEGRFVEHEIKVNQ